MEARRHRGLKLKSSPLSQTRPAGPSPLFLVFGGDVHRHSLLIAICPLSPRKTPQDDLEEQRGVLLPPLLQESISLSAHFIPEQDRFADSRDVVQERRSGKQFRKGASTIRSVEYRAAGIQERARIQNLRRSTRPRPPFTEQQQPSIPFRDCIATGTNVTRHRSVLYTASGDQPSSSQRPASNTPPTRVRCCFRVARSKQISTEPKTGM
jgi:hypothetical protein